MKYIFKIAIIALGFTFMSCGKSFLEKYDPTQLNAGNFYKTETQMTQAVNGVYSQMQDLVANQWKFTEYISDNTTLHFNIGDRGQGPDMEAIEYWQINSSTGSITAWYDLLYRGLGNINSTLEKLPGAEMTDAARSNFEGQLKFFRAFYYFQLVQGFGEVIIVTKPMQSPSEAYTYARMPVADVYKLIESDLTFAITSLPAPSDIPAAEKGRVSKGAALSLLGKVYLTKKQYGDAVTTLKQVLTLGYNLMTNYADVFDPDKKNNAESVFEVQFQADSDIGEWSGFLDNFYPRESYGAVIKFLNANGGGWNIPTLDMIGAYEVGDLRKAVSIKEGYTNLQGIWVPVPFISKYYHPASYTIKGRQGDNWPVIRYADVLLMLAEAINEQSGPSGEALGYINQIRVRAGLNPLSVLSKELFRTAVFNERRIELAFENDRWYQLKRTLTPTDMATLLNAHGDRERAHPTTDRGGIPFSAGDYKFVPYEELFPIPANEILINKALTQNEGY
jgi:hypothetical protein